MKTYGFDNEARTSLIKDAQKAINKACFIPSKDAKSEALKSIKALQTFVEGLETSKKKPKAKRQPKVETPDVQSLIAEATAKAVADALAKLGVEKEQPKVESKAKPKPTKSKTSRRRKKVSNPPAKLNSNQRLEVQAQRASRGLAQTYLPTEEPKARKVSNKQAVLPFQLEIGQCPMEAARHAKHLAEQDILSQGAPMYSDTDIDTSDCPF
jgi:hypothetical protein